MRNRQLGLTLVELMVVVAVMAVIASIAYPLYTNQVQKSRRADAKIALQMVAMAQERLYTLNGSYVHTMSSLQVDPQVPRAIWDFDESVQGYYGLSFDASASGDSEFTVIAVAKSGGAQGSDSACPQFTLDELGARGATSGNCW